MSLTFSNSDPNHRSIDTYDHIKVSLIDQSLLLILAQIQYPLKVKSLCGIIAW